MKKFLILLTAAVLFAIPFFAVVYYVFDMEKNDAISLTISSAAAGLVGAYVGEYFEKKKKNRNTERTRV